jgi:hypothetical protein
VPWNVVVELSATMTGAPGDAKSVAGISTTRPVQLAVL